MENTDFTSACTNCVVGITFDVPEDLKSVHYLRNKARKVMDILDINSHDAGDLEVILGELATNVVRHAKGKQFQVRIALDQDENQVVILVIDDGVGFAPDVLPLPGTLRSATLPEEVGVGERIGGFGLPLVRTIADTVEILSNEKPAVGMTVRATKSLQNKK